MVEFGIFRMNHRCRFAGEGIKPPKGALFKRHGAERLGKGFTTSKVRMNKGIERKRTADEVSGSGHILSKAVAYVMQ